MSIEEHFSPFGAILRMTRPIFAQAAMLSRYSTHDRTALQVWKRLRMATREGARAWGMEDQIGSLHADKLADIVVIGL